MSSELALVKDFSHNFAGAMHSPFIAEMATQYQTYPQSKGRNEGLPYIPEDLELLVTVQRCSNLPARAASGALPPPRARGEETGGAN